MDIRPATLAQVQRGRDGRFVQIDDDVSGIAADLAAIDPTLRLRYSETGGYFVVYQQFENGEEHLVLTSVELSPLVVDRVRRITSPSYDLVAEMDRVDKAADAEQEHRFNEQVGEIGERLAHAIRKDVGAPRIIVPRDV